MAEVEIELFTQLGEEYQVPSDPLVVPSSSARWPLSELVNQLLASDDEDRVRTPFDFLIDGQFIHTSLAEWMQAHERTAEQRIKVEYVLAMRKPDTAAVDQRDAWVAAVDASGGAVVATWYDGVGRAYQSGNTVTWQDTESPLKCVATRSVGASVAVTGAEDGAVRFSVLGKRRTETGVGRHEEAVTSCALSEDASLACTGDARGGVRIWHVDPAVEGGSPKQKRGAPERDPKLALEGHSDVVSSCTVRGFSLLTASHDLHVRAWDLLTGSLASSWPVRAAAMSLAVHRDTSCIATAHADGGIQVWDVRTENKDLSKSSLEVRMTHTTHKRLVASVAWCPDHDFWLASACHDQTVKVYDIRSPTALQSVHVGAKATCVAWDGRVVVSGAADGEVRRHAM